MLLQSCTTFTDNTNDSCALFQYVTPSESDVLTPLTERQILNNDMILEQVCKKARPPEKVTPSWIQRHLSVKIQAHPLTQGLHLSSASATFLGDF